MPACSHRGCLAYTVVVMLWVGTLCMLVNAVLFVRNNYSIHIGWRLHNEQNLLPAAQHYYGRFHAELNVLDVLGSLFIQACVVLWALL